MDESVKVFYSQSLSVIVTVAAAGDFMETLESTSLSRVTKTVSAISKMVSFMIGSKIFLMLLNSPTLNVIVGEGLV